MRGGIEIAACSRRIYYKIVNSRKEKIDEGNT